MSFSTLVAGFITGFPVMIAVGPISLLLIEQGLERGARAAAPAALGVAAADLTFAALSAVVGTAVVQALEAYSIWLQVGSAALMGALAWKLARSAMVELRSSRTAEVPELALIGVGGPADGRTGSEGLPPRSLSPRSLPPVPAVPFATMRGIRLAGGFYGLTIVNPLTIVVFVGIVAAGGTGVGTAGWVIGMVLASLTVHTGFVFAGRALGAALGESAAARVRLGAAVLMTAMAIHFLLA